MWEVLVLDWVNMLFEMDILYCRTGLVREANSEEGTLLRARQQAEEWRLWRYNAYNRGRCAKGL